MGVDLLRVESNERVDKVDFDHAVDTSQQGQHRQIGAEFLGDPDRVGSQQFIIDGFEIDNPAGDQIQVTLGRAILAQRENGQVFNGQLASQGEPTRIIDVNGFADATYGIFIRFEYVDGDSQGRAFWNPQGSGSEFAQNTPTRRIANWSMRIEIATPGSEWFQIGQLIMSAGSISTGAGGLRDLRKLYFEGQRIRDLPPVAGAPTDIGTQYESGWSTDGGGLASDRDNDRNLNGVKDLQTMLGALKQCVEDIKGRGLRRWWERDIGGLNVGFDANPVEDHVSVGDADFFMSNIGGLNTGFQFDVGDTWRFFRATNTWDWFLNSAIEMRLDSDGLEISNGLSVGFLTPPPNDAVVVGDSEFGLFWNFGLQPGVVFEFTGGSSSLFFDRVSNRFDWFIAGTVEAALYATGMNIIGGLNVGYTATPTDDQANFFDTNFDLRLDGGDPRITFDTSGGADFMRYDRANNELGMFMGNLLRFGVRPTSTNTMIVGRSGSSFRWSFDDAANDEAFIINSSAALLELGRDSTGAIVDGDADAVTLFLQSVDNNNDPQLRLDAPSGVPTNTDHPEFGHFFQRSTGAFMRRTGHVNTGITDSYGAIPFTVGGERNNSGDTFQTFPDDTIWTGFGVGLGRITFSAGTMFNYWTHYLIFGAAYRDGNVSDMGLRLRLSNTTMVTLTFEPDTDQGSFNANDQWAMEMWIATPQTGAGVSLYGFCRAYWWENNDQPTPAGQLHPIGGTTERSGAGTSGFTQFIDAEFNSAVNGHTKTIQAVNRHCWTQSLA